MHNFQNLYCKKKMTVCSLCNQITQTGVTKMLCLSRTIWQAVSKALITCRKPDSSQEVVLDEEVQVDISRCTHKKGTTGLGVQLRRTVLALHIQVPGFNLQYCKKGKEKRGNNRGCCCPPLKPPELFQISYTKVLLQKIHTG